MFFQKLLEGYLLKLFKKKLFSIIFFLPKLSILGLSRFKNIYVFVCTCKVAKMGGGEGSYQIYPLRMLVLR